MRIPFLGLTITRTKAYVGPATDGLSSLSTGRSGWWPVIRESFAGAWQRNQEIQVTDVTAYSSVFACVSLIASDIAKLRIKLMREKENGVWEEVTSPSFSPVLRKPNHYQTRIKFIEQWLISKLLWGNTYVLKQRDKRGVVTAMYVLDPSRVKPLVAPNGEVYYSLDSDNLSKLPEAVVVPAGEIIHDINLALYHPLVGVSPIYAAGMAAWQGLKAQTHSATLFANGARPSGILTAVGSISEETAKILREQWEANYGGDNVGRVAVVGDGLKWEQMTMNAVDAQLIEQLGWADKNVCMAYGVPPFKIGVADPPANSTVEALNIQYYAQCIQKHVESIELLLDYGIGLIDQTPEMGTEFDIDALLRMDTSTRVKAASEAIGGSGMTPNEARERFFGLGPIEGGDTCYMQQQNYSLKALAKRDALDDPFASTSGSRAEAPAPTPPEPTGDAEKFSGYLRKELTAA
jgi:HK97 family phage portal protein